MKPVPVSDDIVLDHLNRVLQLADNQALFELVRALAKQIGETQIEGMSLETYFDRKRREIAKRLLQDFGEKFPPLAKQTEQAWKRLTTE